MEANWQLYEYRRMAVDLVTDGELVPDGTRELLGYEYWLNPYNPWFAIEERKLNVPFIMKEMLWYLQGDPSAQWIGQHAGVWKSVLEHDGMAVSNYGRTLYRDQRLLKAARLLEEEPDTRRAIVFFGNNGEGLRDHDTYKDQSCANSIHFLLRDDVLNVVISQRAQDYIYGVSGDAVFMVMAANLVAAYLGVDINPIKVQCASFHHYPKHKEMVSKLLNPTMYEIEWQFKELLDRKMAKEVMLFGKDRRNAYIDWINDWAWMNKENFWT